MLLTCELMSRFRHYRPNTLAPHSAPSHKSEALLHLLHGSEQARSRLVVTAASRLANASRMAAVLLRTLELPLAVAQASYRSECERFRRTSQMYGHRWSGKLCAFKKALTRKQNSPSACHISYAVLDYEVFSRQLSCCCAAQQRSIMLAQHS